MHQWGTSRARFRCYQLLGWWSKCCFGQGTLISSSIRPFIACSLSFIFSLCILLFFIFFFSYVFFFFPLLILLQVGPSLRKLVIGYNLFITEPDLAIIIVENCPNLEHFEMRSPALAHGVNIQLPIPTTLPSRCSLLRTFGWVCFHSLANQFDLSPISQMRNLRHLTLSNISILNNTGFYTSVINSGLPLITLELNLPHTFHTHGLASFAPLGPTLQTLRLYNCSYNLRALQLNLLPRLRSMTYYTSRRECDFETIDIMTALPLDTLEIRFQSSLRSIQLRERFVQLMSNKKNNRYHLTTRGTLYDTFCYTISS